MRWTDAVFQIRGCDPKGKEFGTGFACGRDGDALYVVTCWHVVCDIGEPYLRIHNMEPPAAELLRRHAQEYLRIEGNPCELVSSDGDLVLDLAVLRVKGLTVGQVPGLAQEAASERTFKTFGFAEDEKEPEPMVVGRNLSAVLGAETSRVHPTHERVLAWDYYLKDGSRELDRVKDGYSGAPVYDPDTHRVVAVITHRKGTDKGFAIDIANLERVYPGAARFFTPAQIAGPGQPSPLPRCLLVVALAAATGIWPADVGREPAAPSPPPALSAFRDPLKSGGVGPEMVSLPDGRFLMGSPGTESGRDDDEGPQRQVDIPPFALSRTEVSFADYDRFADATGRRKPDDRGWGRGARPVINVSWNDARAYADWLSAQTGKRYRLPTEAEWEYAARAGSTAAYALPAPQGSGDIARRGLANCDGCGSKWDNKSTAPVGSFPPNAWGLHDLHGNVREWTEDCWHASYSGAPADGSAWRDTQGGNCARRVLRGGSWVNFPGYLRSANRYWFTADVAYDIVGLRLARTP